MQLLASCQDKMALKIARQVANNNNNGTDSKRASYKQQSLNSYIDLADHDMKNSHDIFLLAWIAQSSLHIVETFTMISLLPSKVAIIIFDFYEMFQKYDMHNLNVRWSVWPTSPTPSHYKRR